MKNFSLLVFLAMTLSFLQAETIEKTYYFSNPNEEDVFEKVYSVMYEYNPAKYPAIF